MNANAIQEKILSDARTSASDIMRDANEKAARLRDAAEKRMAAAHSRLMMQASEDAEAARLRLGHMGELGENEKELHREVGTFAGNCGIDLLICVGTLAKEIAEAAKESSIQAEKQLEAVSFDTLEELLMHLGEQVKQGDTILVKASHFMQFEEVVKALEEM